jgi:Fic family protein
MTRLPVLTRGECREWQRPCLLRQCRYHLAEMAPRSSETCALDIAERGDHSAKELEGILGISDSALQDIEHAARAKLAKHRDQLDTDNRCDKRSAGERIAAELGKRGAQTAPALITAIPGFNWRTIYHALEQLLKAGKVTRTGKIWRLSECTS